MGENKQKRKTTFKYCFYYLQTPNSSNINLCTCVIIASALIKNCSQTVGTQPSSNNKKISKKKFLETAKIRPHPETIKEIYIILIIIHQNLQNKKI